MCKKIREITVDELSSLPLDSYCCVDVRSEISYENGHITNARFWDCSDEAAKKLPKDKLLVVYCGYGEQSVSLVKRLSELGFNTCNLSGGFRAWLLDYFKNPVENELSASEIERYDRQIILPQIGLDGQKRLKNSSVLVVGAGGLGSPSALYLAGAGVGRIGIIDSDSVSVSNLQRQILHTFGRIGQNKSDSAKEALQLLNDKIKAEAYPFALTAENAEEIISKYDFVIDGADNFETKFLINDACVLLKKAFCHAGILRFEGQAMTYVPDKSPCYRCVFEKPPQKGEIPNCSQAGVIGAVAGILGSVQALEAIKYLLNIGELLTGRIFVFDALTMKSRIVKCDMNSHSCELCSGKIKNLQELSEQYIHSPDCF